MTQVPSKPAECFDISSASFRGAARDLGEVLALMAGGVRPDPDTLARLHLSLRLLQGFLLDEAVQQEGREAIRGAMHQTGHESLATVLSQLGVTRNPGFSPPMPPNFEGIPMAEVS